MKRSEVGSVLGNEREPVQDFVELEERLQEWSNWFKITINLKKKKKIEKKYWKKNENKKKNEKKLEKKNEKKKKKLWKRVKRKLFLCITVRGDIEISY